ncbi:MAG TPA: SDR family NAD(P)-dependent oxidoreductase [Nitrospiria bacterium]|nr:SDR family NAD(P)-dependent oxidoreductase [Nitrospiria bacterium]
MITGSSRGLGRSLAQCCGSAGWRVVVHCRERRAEADAVAASITASGGDALVVQHDVTDPTAFRNIVERAMAAWGRIDAWVNNAGMVDDRLLLSATDATWDRTVSVHLTAAHRAIQAVSPVMHGQGGGVILNVVSLAALQGRRGQAAYSAAKAGSIALTRTAARELAQHGIRVNAVCPPVLDTDAVGPRATTLRRQQLIPDPVSLDGAADAIRAVLTLPWMTGQTIVLDSRIPEGAL